MAKIKYKAGDEVFWLNSFGFQKGKVKSVFFNEEIYEDGNIISKLVYRLANDISNPYMGDEVKEHLIFKSYNDMLEFYKSSFGTGGATAVNVINSNAENP